jgi:hypothetical protein
MALGGTRRGHQFLPLPSGKVWIGAAYTPILSGTDMILSQKRFRLIPRFDYRIDRAYGVPIKALTEFNQ